MRANRPLDMSLIAHVLMGQLIYELNITQEICVVIQGAVLSAKGATNVSKLGLSVSPVHAVLHMLALVR